MTAVGGRRSAIGCGRSSPRCSSPPRSSAREGLSSAASSSVEIGSRCSPAWCSRRPPSWAAAPRLYGVGAVAAFALLALLTGLSITWSVAPDESWIEANRTLTYLFVFTAAVAAGNLLPGSLRAVLAGVTLAALAIVAYALASRVWPESLGELEFYARLGQPFGYWNAVGVTAAMGLLGTVWFGSRRAVPPRLRGTGGARRARS